MGLPVPVALPDGALRSFLEQTVEWAGVRMSRFEALMRVAAMAKGDWKRLHPIARLPQVIDAVLLLPAPDLIQSELPNMETTQP